MIVSGSSLGYVFGLIKSEAPESIILPALYACLAYVGSVNARKFASSVIKSYFGQ